jgi:antitoxin component of MazEF toxin-antitoxin module
LTRFSLALRIAPAVLAAAPIRPGASLATALQGEHTVLRCPHRAHPLAPVALLLRLLVTPR